MLTPRLGEAVDAGAPIRTRARPFAGATCWQHDHLVSSREGGGRDVSARPADAVGEGRSRRRAAVGVPLPDGRSRLEANAARRLRFGAGRGGGIGARAGKRLRRERRVSRSLTLGELVDVYLAQHDVEPVTIEKLRWLLGKAVAAFGERPVSEIWSEEIAAWRIALSPGYRFDATQALRQVLARAMVWRMIEPRDAGCLRPPLVHEGSAEVPEDRGEPPSGAAADDRTRRDRTPATESRERTRVPRTSGRLARPAQLPQSRVEARAGRGRDRAAAQDLRSATHLRHVCAPCRHLHFRPLPLHGREPDHDRPPLRPPRPRRTRARDPPARRARRRPTSTVDAGGRWMDVRRCERRPPRQRN
jgi:hypothetical protein